MMRAKTTVVLGVLVAALFVMWGAALPARAALYEDEGKDVTKGDLNDQDYWWTKWDMMMLDYAIKQKQPEGKIAVELASTSDRLDKLSKKYPKHEEIKKWKAKVDEVNSKIDQNAPRNVSFNPGCPWDEANFAQAWVNLPYAKMEAAARHDDSAMGLIQNVIYNLNLLSGPDRLKDYPEELKKWYADAKGEAEKVKKDLQEKAKK